MKISGHWTHVVVVCAFCILFNHDLHAQDQSVEKITKKKLYYPKNWQIKDKINKKIEVIQYDGRHKH